MTQLEITATSAAQKAPTRPTLSLGSWNTPAARPREPPELPPEPPGAAAAVVDSAFGLG